MADFFTSDTHFYHRNILKKFCVNTRQGEDEVEMTELMILAWNRRVTPNDTVFHLGDVSFAKAEKTRQVLDRLNGKIVFIKGNHDASALDPLCLSRYESVHDYLEVVIDKITVVMFHFPIKEWNKMHYGSFHTYGHVHGKDMGMGDRRALDVGIDNRPDADMSPWSWDEIRKTLEAKPVAKHH